MSIFVELGISEQDVADNDLYGFFFGCPREREVIDVEAVDVTDECNLLGND